VTDLTDGACFDVSCFDALPDCSGIDCDPGCL